MQFGRTIYQFYWSFLLLHPRVPAATADGGSSICKHVLPCPDVDGKVFHSTVSEFSVDG